MNYCPINFCPVTYGRTDRRKVMHKSPPYISTGGLKNYRPPPPDSQSRSDPPTTRRLSCVVHSLSVLLPKDRNWCGRGEIQNAQHYSMFGVMENHPKSQAVLAKYAGHVGQTSADVQQSAPTLLDILSSRVKCTVNVRQQRKELLVIDWEKCLTGDQNVRQSNEGLPDILSGKPEIIFTRTAQDCHYHELFTPKKGSTDYSIYCTRWPLQELSTLT